MEKQHQLTINGPFQDSPRFGNKYYIIQSGNSRDTRQGILKHLHKSIPGLKEVFSVEECDVILVFCPIVSRAGTDMEAALNELNRRSASKPAAFMVLHHTYEQEKIVPDSSRFVSRENTLTVNFLFNEDNGLLECAMNDEALIKIIERFEPQMLRKMGEHWFWYIISTVVNMLLFLRTATHHVIKSVQMLMKKQHWFWYIISTVVNMLLFLCTATHHVIKSVQILWQQVKIWFWFIISTATNIVGGTKNSPEHRRV